MTQIVSEIGKDFRSGWQQRIENMRRLRGWLKIRWKIQASRSGQGRHLLPAMMQFVDHGHGEELAQRLAGLPDPCQSEQLKRFSRGACGSSSTKFNS